MLRRNTFFSFLLLFILFFLLQSLSYPFFIFSEFFYHLELFDLRGWTKGILYLGTYGLAIVIFLILMGLRSALAFSISLVFIFVFLSMDFFIQFLGVSHGFSLDEYRLLVNEANNYQFLISYLDIMLKAIVSAFLVIVLLYLIRKNVYKSRFSTTVVFFLLIPFFIIYAVSHRVDTFKLSAYPSAVKIPAIAIEYLQLSQATKRRVLNQEIVPKHNAKMHNIVWIIDESVTGSYLSVNGYERNTTPYLKAFAKQSNQMANFGVVNSISNCSGKSNLFLRVGMTPREKVEVEKGMYTLPTIFQYAKRAGYTTWLFDSQTQKDYLQNYLTLYDKESIDYFKTLGVEIKRDEKDRYSLDDFVKVVNGAERNSKNFIVVVKYGAHFPYLTSYNHEHSPFKPVLEMAYRSMTMESKDKLVNTYLNAIYSSVDLYLKAVLEKIDLSKTILFYTSDHGQNLLETENLIRPHCNDEALVKNEISVPLFVFHEKAKEMFPVEKDMFYSQIQMFPSTLLLFGYDKTVADKYGQSLEHGFKKSNERRYIISATSEPEVYE